MKVTNYKCVECYFIINQILILVFSEGMSLCQPKQSRKKNKVKGVLAEMNMCRKSQLTPRKSLLYDAVKIYRQKNLVVHKRYTEARTRLKMADKFINTNKKSLCGLNQFTRQFIESQIRMQPQKPRGRRFTIDDKVFALSLFKQSGKAYRTLSKVFALPSRKSIMDLLNKIPFDTGINKRIFDHLKTAVKKLKNKLDRYCSIIFDEVSISSSLQFTEKNGKVIGFEDLGNDNCSPKFSDKALVFMVRGLRKKFKQPVAFYLTNSNMNSLNLSNILKDVITAVQSTGLTVISTVCDQAPSNVAAINRLLKETKDNTNLKTEEKNDVFGFVIGGQEIIPLFDVPHLLKGLRNNLITKDLNFTYENKQKKASWKHVIQFYEFDKDQSTEGDRLVPKLSDSHVYPEKIKKMKVSIAAQVFSQRVGAIMKRMAIMTNTSNFTGKLYIYL